MRAKAKKVRNQNTTLYTRITYSILLCILAAVCFFLVFLLKTKEFAFDTAILYTKNVPTEEIVIIPEVFPIGVNPLTKTITENGAVETYLASHLTLQTKRNTKENWLNHTLAILAQFDWYQNLASPMSRILVIESGERKEEVADNFGDILKWTDAERDSFISIIAGSTPQLTEGKFFPDHYVVTKDATPEIVAQLVTNQFNLEVLSHYTSDVANIVPLNDALTIASLLEREAYDFEDMRYISGVIWNRLFINMNLQIDASLQYAKANEQKSIWWPVPRPSDKYINSPFNTYKNKGLPPTPIANPSTEAILAALNPRSTDCIFYFHDQDGGFHCTPTYEEHVALLKQYYGQGK